MKRWRKTISINEIIHRDQQNTDPTYVSKVGKEIAGLVRNRTTPGEQNFELLNAVETLEEISPDDDDALDQFNSALSELYDWADRERVWLGI